MPRSVRSPWQHRDNAGAQQCYSQGASAQLDSEACFASGGKQYEFCAPSTVTQLFVSRWTAAGRHFGSQLLQLDRRADLLGRDLLRGNAEQRHQRDHRGTTRHHRHHRIRRRLRIVRGILHHLPA